MTSLADAVLTLIRTRADLHRWGAASEHGRQMHQAVNVLEAAVPTTAPGEVYTVTHKALASAITVIARADDSSGIIGDACRRLLALHTKTAAAAKVPTARLVDWMMKFQFEGEVDYFELDPVAYAPALGETGMKTYRARLNAIRDRLGPRPADRWDSSNRREWFVLEWNDSRLAVFDHDVEAIIRTHARDRKVAAWYEDTAEALEEIGEIDLAIDWARQGMDFGPGHQSQACGELWCRLLSQHRPHEWLGARRTVFDRWPEHSTAARLREAAGTAWPQHREHVLDRLASTPSDAVMFALSTLKEPRLAWDLANQLALSDGRTWHELLKTYEKIDPIAVLPIHARLVAADLREADAKRYRSGARRLVTMRRLAAGTGHAHEVDDLVAQLRDEHRRRRRLQQEFDRAGLP
ncbi:hypothetical protein Kisp01_71380 [Kineosporia sp. NBRC 101677]|uniref:DUF6880 family protein n=1 Tax=Kineosporia sp. NBRC 101677 TaxID=3032197 RepID=UPI0024A1BD49|nr:DUF6880 family protein [Kineosporia sp. NBRC 101677]GLY20124.1 hypothetical protein Kisp01_71380 [Kineosporia sp. NBRC 101677]